MADLSIVNLWLDRAKKDLVIAQEDIKDPQRSEYVAFNCQQAAEKYLKAFIIKNELKFKATHDLVNLLEICIEKDSEFTKLREFAEELTPFYIETRYPDFIAAITGEKAELALKCAQKIAELVIRKIR